MYQEGRQTYELVLDYNFNLQKSTECTCELPGLSNYLYESELDCQLWMVFTNNKQYIFAGEAFPTRVIFIKLHFPITAYFCVWFVKSNKSLIAFPND